MSLHEIPKLKVAICGAGISGLALAAFLSSSKRSDVQIDIYEAKNEISSDGSGIAVWRRTWQVLETLGFEKDCTERCIRTPQDGQSSGPKFRRSDTIDKVENFHSQVMPYGPILLGRPQLLEILQEKLSPANCKIHQMKKVARYETNGSGQGITIYFDHITETATADVLVGCDGVHSKVRATLFQHDPNLARPVFSGQLAYRSQFKVEGSDEWSSDPEALTEMRVWCGVGRHVISNPYTHPKTKQTSIFLVCFNNVPGGRDVDFEEWSAKVEAKEIQQLFPRGKWEHSLASFVEKSDSPTRWAVHIVKPLPYFAKGNVALVGDAAHAMTPHQGIGAGQGVEDAYILGRLLTHPARTRDNLSMFLDIYNRVRLAPALAAVEKSRRTGELYDLFPLEEGGMDLKTLGEKISDEFSWLGLGGVEDEWRKTEAMLLEEIST